MKMKWFFFSAYISIFIVWYSGGNSKNTSKDVLNKILDQIFTAIFPCYTMLPPPPYYQLRTTRTFPQ